MVPDALGVTATVILALCPVARDIGKTAPGNENCGFDMLTWVMESEVFPVLVTAMVCVLCFPTLTFPKLMLAGFSWKAAWIAVLVPPTKPAQPPRKPARSIAVSRAA